MQYGIGLVGCGMHACSMVWGAGGVPPPLLLGRGILVPAHALCSTWKQPAQRAGTNAGTNGASHTLFGFGFCLLLRWAVGSKGFGTPPAACVRLAELKRPWVSRHILARDAAQRERR